MSIKKCVLKLIGFGLNQVVMGESAETVVDFIHSRLESQADELRKALVRAHKRAWQVVGMALGGDTMLARLKKTVAEADHRLMAASIRKLLESGALNLEGQRDGFRQTCLQEWQIARRQGLLNVQLESGDLAEAVQSLPLRPDVDLIALAGQAVAALATDLSDTCPNLAKVIQYGQPPLLVAVFSFCLRNEVRKNEDLDDELKTQELRRLYGNNRQIFRELDELCDRFEAHFDRLFDQLDQLQDTATDTNRKVAELCRMMQELFARQHIPNRGPMRGEYSYCIRDENERKAVRAFLEQYRRLDDETRRRCPELLNNLGRLQVSTGYYEEAEESFTAEAAYREKSQDKAEAHYNAFIAALEARNWSVALENISEAWKLDEQRFTMFPLRKYQPMRILGAGGFGIAFLCTDRYTNFQVVIKTLRPECLDRNATAIFQEASMLFSLNHQNIIAARTADYADEAEQRPYLVMNYFDGQNLDEYLQNEKLSEAEVVEIIQQVAQGVDAAHKKGIYHRDLKPGNVLIRRDANSWQVKVIDFGLALRHEMLVPVRSDKSDRYGYCGYSRLRTA